MGFLFFKRPKNKNKHKNISTYIIGIIAALAVFYLFNMYQDSTYYDTGEKKDYINLPKLEK